jgi:hypothetical protein
MSVDTELDAAQPPADADAPGPGRASVRRRALPVLVGVVAAVLLLVGWQLTSTRTLAGSPFVDADDLASLDRGLSDNGGQLPPDTAGPTPAPTTAPPTTTAAPAPAAGPGPVAAGRAPSPGQVGFRGNAGSLKVVDGPGSAPPGTTWSDGVLRVDGGDLTLDGYFVKGGVEYSGRGTLSIRNSVVEGDGRMHSPIIGNTGTVEVRDTTVRWKAGDEGPGGSWGNGAIHGDSRFVVIRCDISGTPDGIQTGAHDSRFEQNYIHDLAMFGTYPNETHNDGIQSYGGRNVVIANNRIDLRDKQGRAYNEHQNAALFFMPDSDWPLVNAQIVGNWLSGGGFTLRMNDSVTNAVVTDNQFGPTTGGWGELLIEGSQISKWSNNTDVDGRQLPKP